jgi:hypothetical protein
MIAVSGEHLSEAEMKLPFEPRSALFIALGALYVGLSPLPAHYAERANRHEVMAHGTETSALVEQSSGLEKVLVGWVDPNGHIHTGEAYTRKQVSGRSFVGKHVGIKYLDDPAAQPVILSEVDEREWTNQFWLFLNPLILLVLSGVMLWYQSLLARGRAHPSIR